MPASCATRAEFLAVAPEFQTYGSTSTIKITANAGTVGDRFILTSADFPNQVITWTAVAASPTLGSEYLAGTPIETAASLVDSINAQGQFATATVTNGPIFALESIQTGVDGLHTVTQKPDGSFQFPNGTEEDTLEGGAALIDQTLSCACSQINLACWGVKSDCAHIYLTAHMLSLAIGQESGPVSSRTIDKISESYAIAAATGSDAGLSSTPWGRLYAQLRRTLFVAPLAGRRFLGRF